MATRFQPCPFSSGRRTCHCTWIVSTLTLRNAIAVQPVKFCLSLKVAHESSVRFLKLLGPNLLESAFDP